MGIKDDEPAGPDSFGRSDEDSHYMSTKQGLLLGHESKTLTRDDLREKEDRSKFLDEFDRIAQGGPNPDPTPCDRIMGRLLRYQVSPEETKRIIEKLGITDENAQELRTNLRARYPHLVKLLEEADGE